MPNRLNISFFGSSLASTRDDSPAGYYRGLLRALHERGHRVTFYEPETEEYTQEDNLPQPGWARIVMYPPTDEDALETLERAEDSDLIVKCGNIGVGDDLLDAAVLELQRPYTLVAYLDVNAPATLARLAGDPEDSFHQLVSEYDFIITRGGGKPVVDAYLAAGAGNCVVIYDALDPDAHFPVPPDPRFEADLGFLGDRTPVVEVRLDEFFLKAAAGFPEGKFLLGGEGWRDQSMPANVNAVGRIDPLEHNAFNHTPRAALALNGGAPSGFLPSARLFEAAGAGACLITDPWPGLEQFLEPDRDVLVAQSGEQVIEHLRRLTPERARAIGEAARKRFLAEHTYKHRAEQLEQLLAERMGRIAV